jgi:ABC-type uncharacterized transport system substrate-binding protein
MATPPPWCVRPFGLRERQRSDDAPGTTTDRIGPGVVLRDPGPGASPASRSVARARGTYSGSHGRALLARHAWDSRRGLPERGRHPTGAGIDHVGLETDHFPGDVGVALAASAARPSLYHQGLAFDVAEPAQLRKQHPQHRILRLGHLRHWARGIHDCQSLELPLRLRLGGEWRGKNSSQRAQQESAAVQIVTVTSDPVGLGLAASLARPGGNVTGLTVDAGIELIGKRLELLKEAVPGATRMGFLVPQQAWEGGWGRTMREAAGLARTTSIAATLDDPIGEPEYRRAFAVLAKERAQGLVVTDHAEGLANLRLIVELAAQVRVPAIYTFREYAEAGGLMAYATDRAELVRHVAGYIDRILKGANPTELPFQQPTKFELVINLKTAKALGLTIPPSLLLRADQVIE